MEKMIEPTDEMINDVELRHKLMYMDDIDIMRATLNHPDAAKLFADDDDRPWEPLDQKDLDTIQKGDEVERTYVSTDKSLLLVRGIADHQDSDGDWMTSGGRFLTVNENSDRTYRIRRAARPELPTVRPATIADVTINGLTCSRMDLTVYNKWVGVDQYGRIQLWTSSEVSTADWRPYCGEEKEDQ